jgi:hypothetical protein
VANRAERPAADLANTFDDCISGRADLVALQLPTMSAARQADRSGVSKAVFPSPVLNAHAIEMAFPQVDVICKHGPP